jgi:hypothetical protein
MPEQTAAGRRVPHPLPAWAFVPGRGPHPHKGPGGHGHTGPPLVPGLDWAAQPCWSHGLDLYDHGFDWECHEVLEALWRALPGGPARELVQGVIQLAAARLVATKGDPAAAGRLWARAGARLRVARAGLGPTAGGLDLDALVERAAAPGPAAPGERLPVAAVAAARH